VLGTNHTIVSSLLEKSEKVIHSSVRLFTISKTSFSVSLPDSFTLFTIFSILVLPKYFSLDKLETKLFTISLVLFFINHPSFSKFLTETLPVAFASATMVFVNQSTSFRYI